MSELHRGDPLQVSIETATIDGSGVARVDGQVVFVPGALPGERCSVRIAHVGRSAVFAQLLSVLTPSVHRVEPDCMIVNEEGRLLDLPLNYVGSYFYGTDQHGEPIVGNIVIMKDGYRGGEPDIVGLNDVEAEQIKDVIIDLIEPLHQQPKGEST